MKGKAAGYSMVETAPVSSIAVRITFKSIKDSEKI
jgi:hypothetical protein